MDETQNNLVVTSPADNPTSTTIPSALPTGNTFTDQYNAQRLQQLNDLYDKNAASITSNLQTTYDQNKSDLEAARAKISPMYQQRMNEMGAEYERIRHNNNIQAAASGINTGAGSQMQLAQGNAYQSGQGTLRKAEGEALTEADRGITDLTTTFRNQMADAVNNNDFDRAKAIFDLYGDQYSQMMQQAEHRAGYGDFSIYAQIYGQDAAKTMEKSWLLQHPQEAYTTGKITADEYFKMTGKHPADVAEAMYSSGYGSSGGRSGGTPQGYYSSGSVAAWQRANGVSADGIAGGKTLAALNDKISQGDADASALRQKWFGY